MEHKLINQFPSCYIALFWKHLNKQLDGSHTPIQETKPTHTEPKWLAVLRAGSWTM